MFATATRSTSLGNRNHPCRCGSGRKFKHCCAASSPAPSAFDLNLQQGIEHLQADDAPRALLCFAEALRIQPNSAPAVSNLGVTFVRLNETQRALTCYRQAIQLDPNFAPAHSNLGQLLYALGHATEAAESLQTAIQLNPTLADAWVNLGAALRSLGRFDEAADASHRALHLRPRDVDAHLNLGNALKEQGQLSEAAAVYRRAIDLNPHDPRPHSNLGETLRDQAQPEAAAHAYERAVAASPTFAPAYSNLLYLHAFTRDITPAAELALARNFERRILTLEERAEARAAASPHSGVFQPTPLDSRPLRLGIVSAELGTHAVAEFLQPILENFNRTANLDRPAVHLTLFPTTGRHDARADHFRSLANDFHPITTLTDPAAVNLIRSRHIDVLLDTSGHTVGNRLGVFARRAAPVQATYVGYWSTTGLTEMDYYVADPDAGPALEPHFAENLYRLPRLGTTYRGDPALAIDWQPDPHGRLRLGSFNKFAKIREQTIALWSTALHALPNSVLILEDRGTNEHESHHRIRSGFATHNIDPTRISFIPYIPGHERHMSLYNQIDIALDTIPFNSGTTGFDALWMGVPLITVEGQTMGSRIATAALNALGRPEWVAPTPETFANLVCDVATTLSPNPPTRNNQREALRHHMQSSPLLDAPTLTRALESAFADMYIRWLQTA
ncbi:MAG: tetratricopeptide repeat protein [Acidobacteriota bacterium]